MQGLHRGYQNKILENHERAELCSLPNQRCQNPDLSFISDHQKADERGFMERSEKIMPMVMFTIIKNILVSNISCSFFVLCCPLFICITTVLNWLLLLVLGSEQNLIKMQIIIPSWCILPWYSLDLIRNYASSNIYNLAWSGNNRKPNL